MVCPFFFPQHLKNLIQKKSAECFSTFSGSNRTVLSFRTTPLGCSGILKSWTIKSSFTRSALYSWHLPNRLFSEYLRNTSYYLITIYFLFLASYPLRRDVTFFCFLVSHHHSAFRYYAMQPIMVAKLYLHLSLHLLQN